MDNETKSNGYIPQSPNCNMWGDCKKHINESTELFRKLNEAIGATKETVPQIVSALHDLNISVKDLKDNLVGPATGRKQVPLTSHLIIVFSLALALILVKLDTGHSLSVGGPSGLTITHENTTR
jgi:hypothetical protein